MLDLQPVHEVDKTLIDLQDIGCIFPSVHLIEKSKPLMGIHKGAADMVFHGILRVKEYQDGVVCIRILPVGLDNLKGAIVSRVRCLLAILDRCRIKIKY